MWTSVIGSQYRGQNGIDAAAWGFTVALTSLTASMTVNALVTGLIVFKIFKVFREVKVTMDNKSLCVTGGGRLRSVMFAIIESGMVLFAIQLARLVITATTLTTSPEIDAYNMISRIHQMINVTISSIIVIFYILTDNVDLARV